MRPLIGVLLMILAVPVAQAFELEGEAIQGGLMYGQVAVGATVTVGDRTVRVAEDGRIIFGFDHKQGGETDVEVQNPDGTVERRTLSVGQRDYQIQRIDGLPRDKTVFSEEQLKRIRADQAAVRAARAHDTPELDFGTGFDWPLVGPITGVYGSGRILNGEPRQPHFGVDIAAPAGTLVEAAAGGVVRLARNLYLAGRTIVIDHGHGISTSYLHLSEMLVEVGQRIEKGDILGKVGTAGRSTGPHLDWRLNWRDVRLDASLAVGPMPVAE